MTPPVFYVQPDELSGKQVGSIVELTGDEGRHAATVKRLRVGQAIAIADGLGLVALGRVHSVPDKTTITLAVEQLAHLSPPTPKLTVVQALIKGERMERAIETLTEVGVDEIICWAAASSVVRLDAPGASKALDKWTRRAKESSKQARRVLPAQVSGIISTQELVLQISAGSTVLILDENAPFSLADVEMGGEDLMIVVGPEGGLTDEERHELTEVGGRRVHMGPAVLRASTAGTVAAGVVLSLGGRWSPDGGLAWNT